MGDARNQSDSIEIEEMRKAGNTILDELNDLKEELLKSLPKGENGKYWKALIQNYGKSPGNSTYIVVPARKEDDKSREMTKIAEKIFQIGQLAGSPKMKNLQSAQKEFANLKTMLRSAIDVSEQQQQIRFMGGLKLRTSKVASGLLSVMRKFNSSEQKIKAAIESAERKINQNKQVQQGHTTDNKLLASSSQGEKKTETPSVTPSLTMGRKGS